MNDTIHGFIQLVFTGIIALFPVINPIVSAFIVSPYFDGLTKQQRRGIIIKIAVYSLLLCTITLFTGHWILELFGITVPIIQLAGGIMICKLGWESLSSSNDEDKKSSAAGAHSISDLNSNIFYPITFPITAGAALRSGKMSD
jgi:multiple antibiotic resistance protein